MKSFCLILLLLLGNQFADIAQAQNTNPSAAKYASDFLAIKELGNDLFQSLKPSFRTRVSSNPFWHKDEIPPYVRPFEFENERTPIVYVSEGFIQLANGVAHAKAINNIEPGFFERYIARLSQASAQQIVPVLPELSDPRYWTDDVINEQLGFFNQIVGGVTAINLAHHYLGHYEKYADRLHDSALNPVTIAMSCTPGEWDQAMKLGVGNALDCGFGFDGLKAFYECILGMEKHGWTFYFLPAKPRLDRLEKLKKELDNIENRFFGQQK